MPAGATNRARRLRRSMTNSERIVWRALRQSLPAFHWRKQVPFGPYIADFCSHSAKLIVEVDGGQHQPETDAARTRFLEGEGYRLIRFWNNEIVENLDGVLEAVRLALGDSQ